MKPDAPAALPLRALIAETAIGLALCGAAYALFVDPVEHQLRSLHDKAAALRAHSQSVDSSNLAPAAVQVAKDRAAALAARIRAASLPAKDETRMLQDLTALAERHRVRVDDLRPAQASSLRRTARERGNGEGKSAALSPVTARIGYGFSLVGGFADTAAFLAAVQTELGFATVTAVRMSTVQDPGSQLVRVQVETEHVAFDTRSLTEVTAETATGANP